MSQHPGKPPKSLTQGCFLMHSTDALPVSKGQPSTIQIDTKLWLRSIL